MLELTIVSLVALAVIAFWFHWGRKVMELVAVLTAPNSPAPRRVRLHRAELSNDELCEEFLRQLESHDRAA